MEWTLRTTRYGDLPCETECGHSETSCMNTREQGCAAYQEAQLQLQEQSGWLGILKEVKNNNQLPWAHSSLLTCSSPI